MSLSPKMVSLAATASIAGALFGCANAASQGEVDAVPALAAPAETRGSSAALRIEQAERTLDIGSDPKSASTTLESVLADPETTVDERDEASLAMSRAFEAEGNKEGAIEQIEKLLAAHAEDRRWPLESAASKRLRKLITGHDEEAPRMRSDAEEQVAPSARFLANYFTPAPDGSTLIKITTFHRVDAEADKLGTFNIAGALRQAKTNACALCDDTVNAHTTESGEGSWTGIPKYQGKLATSLSVFYFDLLDGRIPARYDAELPLPSAEIAAHLEKGEGLVVAKERPGAPPSIVIAAPRPAQLALVEAAFAAMKSLPLEPTVVPIPAGLRPQEIQLVVRAAKGAFRTCYEALLSKEPEASGRVVLAFAIREDGTVEGMSVEEDAALRDPTFHSCFIDATSALHFPATGKRVTVKYPWLFSPGDPPLPSL